MQWRSEGSGGVGLPQAAIRRRSKMGVKFKGELNPKIKLDLNDSFCTLINKYNPHIF